MVKEIKVLDKLPIILTKDKTWRPKTKAKEGAIICLPEDAVLVMPAHKKGPSLLKERKL